MKICSDVDGVILDYIRGFIEFTQREKIPYSHDPELYGVIRNFPDNVEVRDRFHAGDSLRNLKYIDGSLDILNLLASRHELHLVTALEPEQTQKRAENLKSVNYTTLQCVGDLRKEQIIVEEIQPDIELCVTNRVWWAVVISFSFLLPCIIDSQHNLRLPLSLHLLLCLRL